MQYKSIITAIGSYLPAKIIKNAELPARLETSDDWITERTGIKQRSIASDEELTSDLAFNAVMNMKENFNIEIDDIDLIIVATTTPDLTFPSTAAILQKKLGIKVATAFDIQAVCTGFIYALSTAEKFIRTGDHKKALVVGSETFSRILDWDDRSTCVLFGDGAGCFLVEAGDSNAQNNGIIASSLLCAGEFVDILYVDGGVSKNQQAGTVKMNGQKIFKEAVDKLSKICIEVCEKGNINISDIDFVIPHQANQRIISSLTKKLAISEEKVISTVDLHANTSAASVPLAFNKAFIDGKIKRGNKLLLCAIGGGLSWGAVLLDF